MKRIFQRYLIPRFIISLIYLIRDGCFISSQSRVQFSSNIRFGKGTVVKPYAVINTQGGMIHFGKNCAISSFNHISTGLKDVNIGDHVRIAPNVTILGGSRNFEKKDVLIVDQGSYHKGLNIGNDVLIGANVVVMPGCDVGEGAVIGAGSIVTKSINPYTIVAGNPIEKIGHRK